MAIYPQTLLDERTAEPTLEADLVDWTEQNRNVSLPDDEYPHASTHAVVK